jgi:TatD DNase family protein
MNFMDFHCHLDDNVFDETRVKIINECFNSGFSKIVTVTDPYESGSMEKTKDIIELNENIFCIAAVHPHNADHYHMDLEQKMICFTENKKVIAIGETGLDYHYNHSCPENQLNVFKRQIAIAAELNLPLVIHAREAENRVLKILESEKFPLPVIFHCYSGSRDQAREILNRGYYMSVSGIVTFKKAIELQDIVREIPLDRIFTETDSPYLSPDPFRGKVNNPLRVKLVAEKIAEIKNIPVVELNRAVNENFQKLFL